MNSRISDIYDFSPRLLELAQQAEDNCKDAFARISDIAEYNGAKVLKAFTDNKVSEPCFYGSTGSLWHCSEFFAWATRWSR